MFATQNAPLQLDLTLTHLEFVKKWSFYIKMSSIDRVNELKILCQDHLDDPKVQEIMPMILNRSE
jgi:hypothetical protein